MRRRDLLEGDARKRDDAVDLDNELDIMGPQSGDRASVSALAMRRLGLSADPGPSAGQPYKPNYGGADLPEADISFEGPQQTDTSPPVRDAVDAPFSFSQGRAPAPSRDPAPPPRAPAPAETQGDADFSLKAPDFKINNSDRVSQALYAAFTRSKLDPSFFAAPGQDAMRAEELAQKKQHNDFLKDQLRLKYQAKGESLDPEDDNAGSPQSRMAQSAVLGSETLKRVVEGMGGEAAIRNMSARQIQKIFPAKQFSPLMSSEHRVENKIPEEEAKQGGREKLLDTRNTYDATKTAAVIGSREQVAADNREATNNRFNQTQELTKDKMAIGVGSKIPPETKSVFDSGKRIDSLIAELGGEGNLEGVGLITGSFPNPIMGQKTIQLRHEIMNLINTYGHTNFGGALTKDEIARLTKAVGDIKSWRSEAEVLDGVRLIRDLYKSRGDQVLANAPDYVKERLERNNAQKVPDLYGPQPKGPAAPVAPRRPSAPALPTEAKVIEADKPPSEEALADMETPGAPKVEVRVKPGSKVRILDPKGKPHRIDPSEVEEALRHKWRLP